MKITPFYKHPIARRKPDYKVWPSSAPTEALLADNMDTEGLKIISWNLLRSIGATVYDVVQLINNEQPDLLLMQEATEEIDPLPELIGGYYNRAPLPGRIHGVACWSPTPYPETPRTCLLQRGALIRRVTQLINCGTFSIANVHLSHGQILNRRQLRRIADLLPFHAAVLGDFNLVGPALIPKFKDVGPRTHTHHMISLVPIRLDRCLVRGLTCLEAKALHSQSSDHRPILVRLRRNYR